MNASKSIDAWIGDRRPSTDQQTGEMDVSMDLGCQTVAYLCIPQVRI